MKRGFIGPAIVILIGLISIAGLIGLGIYIGKKSSSATYPTPSPTLVTGTSQQTYQAPDESQWETYTNNSLGFSIKHPNLSIEENKAQNPASENIDFTIKKEPDELRESIGIFVTTVPAGTQIKQAIENGYSGVGLYSTEAIKFEEITIGGIKGLYSTDGVPAREYAYDAFIIKGDKLFSFRLSGGSDKYVSLFKQMLSTFRFD